MNRKIYEGITEDSTPDMKYYAFDWDDNIVSMPTEIILIDDEGSEVGMGTEDFAEFRHIIGKEVFKFKGHKIVSLAKNPFRNFRTEGDKQFLVDAMRAEPGPAFEDFKEAINNGSIFAIITARGHNPEILKQAVYNYIVSDFNGINKKELLKNLRKFRNFTDEEDLSDTELIKSYLELNRYNPVSFGDEKGAQNPEIAKVIAMDDFVSYVRSMSDLLNKKSYIKKEMGNEFVPTVPKIGFSDDDVKNIELMKKHFENKPNNIVRTFLTQGGKKRRF